MSTFDKLIVRGRSVLKMHPAAETVVVGIPDGTLRLYNDGTNSFVQMYSLATGIWDTISPDAVAAALYAPIAADYLVGTANGTLTGEIVAGTAPGGELGGTWASPTVDATHSGSAHHTKYTAAEAVTDTAAAIDADVATHAAIATAHHSNANDHAQSHTVESHSDTSGTGAELNTLTDGSNADSLHVHAGGWTLVHSDNTGGSTTNTSEEDVVDITGLSISAAHAIRIEFNTRMNNSAASTRTMQNALHLNGGEIRSAQTAARADSGLDTSGSVEIHIPPRATNFVRGGIFMTDYWTGSAVTHAIVGLSTSALPTATITSITIRGLVSGADCTGSVNYIRVWELPD